MGMENPDYLTRRVRIARQRSDLAICGDLSAGKSSEDLDDPGMQGIQSVSFLSALPLPACVKTRPLKDGGSEPKILQSRGCQQGSFLLAFGHVPDIT